MDLNSPRLEGLEFDHVAIAVRSLADSLPLLERLSGLNGSPPEDVAAQGVRVTFVGPVEVIEPLSDDNGVARFIHKKGPGLHHIAYRVEDVAETMSALQEEGYRFTSEAPMEGRGGHRIAFLHPKSTGGVLIELVEK